MRVFWKLLGALVLTALALGAGMAWWVQRPMGATAKGTEFQVEAGMSPRAVAFGVAQAGTPVNPWLLFAWFRLSGQSRLIKAGTYDIAQDLTPEQLLGKLVRGEQVMRSVTFVEGWTFKQWRQAMAKADALVADTARLDEPGLMAQLGQVGMAAEGRFFPDTYTYAKGSSDLMVWRRALAAMDRRLADAWAQRATDLPLTSPEQALILASIVEKETGAASDRAKISGVFVNRLRLGMPLQTDPTVIYGMGDKFDGNLRRRDLTTDTPWNTYTRMGLPPTPIANPGSASLLAAVRPQPTQALYFVARGDGSSEFSADLNAHNRAVHKFQLGGASR